MKRMVVRRIPLILALLFVLTAAAAGCVSMPGMDSEGSEPDGPEATLARFEAAYNGGDIEAAIECFDPVTVKAVKAAFGLLGDLAGFDVQDVIDLAPFLYNLYDAQAFSNTDLQNAKPEISIRVIETTIDGDSANVRANVSVTAGGQTNEQEATFPMVMQDGVWYIQGSGAR